MTFECSRDDVAAEYDDDLAVSRIAAEEHPRDERDFLVLQLTCRGEELVSHE